MKDQDIKVSTKKPQALQTLVLQPAKTSRRSSRVRIPKIIPDSIMELPIKKSRPRKKVTVLSNAVTELLSNTTSSNLFSDENFNEESFKKRYEKKEPKSENIKKGSLIIKKVQYAMKLRTRNHNLSN